MEGESGTPSPSEGPRNRVTYTNGPPVTLRRWRAGRSMSRRRKAAWNMSDWFEQGGNGNNADVRALLDSKAWDHLLEMLSAGALVSLGLTSDGGALAVTITVDGRWRREYFREADELVIWTDFAREPVVETALARRASSEARTRSRGRRGP